MTGADHRPWADPGPPALLVLGAPRTGTSLVAGMLAAAGARVPGPSVRNWDNPRGHFEATAAVRVSESVLARSGGTWLAAPATVRWSDDEAAERDRILAPVDGRPALVKDPRVLLTWPFWSATARPLALVGTVRHPLAAARSLSAWRRIPLDEGLSLWLAHARTLLAVARERAVPLVDVDAEPASVVASAQQAASRLAAGLDLAAMPAHFAPAELHHDGAGTAAADGALVSECEGVHRALLELVPPEPRRAARAYPWSDLERVRARLEAGDVLAAVAAARMALDRSAEPASVLVPLAAELLRARAFPHVLDLVDDLDVPPALAALVRGKTLFAAGDARGAVRELERACAVPEPFWEARSLLAHALHESGRRREARALLVAIAPDAVHPQQPLGTAAEWAWRAGDAREALDLYARAVELAPPHRRGRLRCRRAELLIELERAGEARRELEASLAEDPEYARAAEVLARVAE